MKVIFLENVEDYKIGEIKDVPDGYARNFLFPRNKAEVATEEKVKEVESKLAKLKKHEAEKVKEAKDIAEKIEKLKLVLAEEVNEEGHLYGSITNREIADLLEEKKIEIDPANIEILEAIKELGEHEVTIKVGHGVETTVKVTVDRKESK
jgi:large subunit ribosomal protein L9